MKNPFPYSDSNKRYHTFDYYLRQRFGTKVFKVALNAGFTCPNIDGTKGIGGCTYCSESGSGDFGGSPLLPLAEQFSQGTEALYQKWGKVPVIAYFQAHTNTYAPLETLRSLYEEALTFPNVVGLSIATRPDCIGTATADYLATLSRRTYLVVELGLQTVHDVTGERINRCHSYADFLRGFELLTERGILVCVHIINGLPGEDREMMLETVRRLSLLPIHAIKIHLLHVLRGTAMAKELEAGAFSLMEQQDYVRLVCDQLRLLPPSVVIQRLTGDGDKANLIGPLWSQNKRAVLNAIDKQLSVVTPDASGRRSFANFGTTDGKVAAAHIFYAHLGYAKKEKWSRLHSLAQSSGARWSLTAVSETPACRNKRNPHP